MLVHGEAPSVTAKRGHTATTTRLFENQEGAVRERSRLALAVGGLA
jgi:hypothetical protein